MAKSRPAIPVAIRDKVLKEFSHRCAICGAIDPQLHHLDENPSNNEPLNLIPLCPNCHLTDQHNPTRRHDPKKLSLFRIYKDPTILLPQFGPLFDRLKFLEHLDQSFTSDVVFAHTRDLIDFVAQLEMGPYYSKKLAQLLEQPATGFCFLIGDAESEARHEADRAEWHRDYQRQVINNRDAVYSACVELLRFQNWKK